MPDSKTVGAHSSAATDNTAALPEGRLPWGVWTAVLYTVFLYLAAQIAVGLVAAIILQLSGVGVERVQSIMTESILLNAALIVGTQIVIAIGVILFMRRRNRSLRAIGVDRFRTNYIGRAFVWYIVYFLLYLAVLSVLSRFIPALMTDQKQDFGFGDPSKTLELLAIGFTLVVMPPLVEELLFRGFLYTSLRQKMSFISSAVLTSLIFAVGHLQIGNDAPLLWAAALDTFILSLVLCHLREKTGSLWPGIIIHMIKNALGFTVLYFAFFMH